MLNTEKIKRLKQILREEVAVLCKGDNLRWKRAIRETTQDLKRINRPAVFFGGTLRSLLLSRYVDNKPGRPRDYDVVVEGAEISSLKEQFGEYVHRENRFGGLQLRRKGWMFDVWPLEKTWAFTNTCLFEKSFTHLPRTTFFNLEAVAIEMWPSPGKARTIYSDKDQFFEGILNKELEINYEENPFPELCVVRALIFAKTLGFSLGPRLIQYISEHGMSLSSNKLVSVQMGHYGTLRASGRELISWIDRINKFSSEQNQNKFTFKEDRQQTLWS